jgi:hypothetical protein
MLFFYQKQQPARAAMSKHKAAILKKTVVRETGEPIWTLTPISRMRRKRILAVITMTLMVGAIITTIGHFL